LKKLQALIIKSPETLRDPFLRPSSSQERKSEREKDQPFLWSLDTQGGGIPPSRGKIEILVSIPCLLSLHFD
jgi:hypothetical protein